MGLAAEQMRHLMERMVPRSRHLLTRIGHERELADIVATTRGVKRAAVEIGYEIAQLRFDEEKEDEQRCVQLYWRTVREPGPLQSMLKHVGDCGDEFDCGADHE